jgi:hypothetical protein
MLQKCTSAVSGYKLSRSQKAVKVQDLNWDQLRESGFMMKNKFIWPADSQGVKRLKRKEEFGLILNLRFLLGWPSRSPGKNHDELINYTVRVMLSIFILRF